MWFSIYPLPFDANDWNVCDFLNDTRNLNPISFMSSHGGMKKCGFSLLASLTHSLTLNILVLEWADPMFSIMSNY